jgi:hypothetical protein
MTEKSKEKKGIEDISEEELLKTKHGMAATQAKRNEANSESVPNET